MARPTDYSQEVADIICAEIASGRSVRSICEGDENLPAARTVYVWLTKHEEFVQQYTRAREAQADALFDDVLEVADNARNDWMERHGEEDIGWRANGEHIQRSKLRVDARKWMASKLQPKKYGEKLQHTGADGVGPVQVTIASEDASIL